MAITPYLYYRDVAEALAFLSKAFAFRKLGRPQLGPDGRIRHAAMKVGDDVVMMGSPGPRFRGPKSRGGATQSLYINVANVDAHFRRARGAGATILEEPSDTDYGQRRYGAADPEGHEWYFAQEMPRAASKKGRRSAGARRKRTSA